VDTFNEILRFKAAWEKEIAAWKPQGRTGLALFNHLFGQVWINARMAAEAAGVSQPTAYKLIDRFVKQGLLVEMTGAKRDRIFLFDAYLKLYRRSDLPSPQPLSRPKHRTDNRKTDH